MAADVKGSDAKGGMSSGQRFAIGANVTIAIAAAAGLLVAVNWICSLRYVREDVASFSRYGLGDRTKRILDGYPEKIGISMLYPFDAEDEAQQGYIERLRDYCDELERYGSNVQIKWVESDSQREKLVAEISGTFGGEAAGHEAALASFGRLREELAAELSQRLLEAGALMGGDSWLGDFPLFADVASTMRSDQEALKKATEEIEELTPAAGIPKYADATSRAKKAATDIKGHFEAIAEALGELAVLAGETGEPDSAHIAMLREVAVSANDAVASLRQLVGGADAPMPEDPSAALKAFADRGVEVGNELDTMVRRVDEFGRKLPMVTQHPNWSAQVQMGPLVMRMGVAGVLQQAGKTLRRARLQILGVIDTGDPNQVRQAMLAARRDVAMLEQNASACEQLLTALADRLSSVDEASKRLLEAAGGGALFADKVAALEALTKEIDDLPELKLGSVADELKQDNTVVVEANGKIRVVGFSEVFPIRQSVAGPGGASEDLGRTFNGDSAISSAILALTRDHPFATVVLVSFEPPPPQQRQQFMPPPPRSWIPSRSLSVLRRRLESANFKVVDWNMATTPDGPQPEEGTENVYVVLPPAPPAQPSPFGGQPPPGPSFGEEHRKKIRELLDNDGRMVFLATWEVVSGGMFGGPPRTPSYGYAELLEQDWGVKVDNGRRVVWIEPDRQKPNTLGVVPRRFGHMPVSGFQRHPVGSPMRGTRFLINDACPIEIKETPPEGVTVETVLRIPLREYYIGARLSELIRIIDQINNRRSEGKVTLDPFPSRGPFDVMVTAERHAGEESKGKIAVVGFGSSVRDDYLQNPVVAEGDVLRLDPPPTECADLFVNTLYWMQGQKQWIARGPVPVPRVEEIEAGEEKALRGFVYFLWPAMVFAPGILLWWVRRR